MSLVEARYVPYQAWTALGTGRALVFAPHPDDEVFGCAGAIISHVTQGDPVKVIVATRGDWGGGDAQVNVRQAESRAAAEVLGYSALDFWDWPDRGLEAGEALREQIRAAIEAWQPAWVYAPSWWEVHPDHTALSQAVTAVLQAQSSPAQLVLYEVGVPLQPNRLLDITPVLGQKQAAMRCFVSQLQARAYDRHVLALNQFRSYTLPETVEAAEAYRCVEVAGLSAIPPAPLMLDQADDPTPRQAAAGGLGCAAWFRRLWRVKPNR